MCTKQARPAGFAAGDGELLDEKVLRRLLERQRVPVVSHASGPRFRDWATEETEHRREVIEAGLAHVVGNKVVYASSDLFERRRLLMDDWGEYIEGTDLSPQNERATESPEPPHLAPR